MAATRAETLNDGFGSLSIESSTAGFYTNLYVKRTDSPINNLINDIINDPSYAKILFSGHRGSGKTTELYNLQSLLQERGFFVVFVAAITDMKTYDLYYTDLLLALIKKSIELLSLQPMKQDKKLRKKLEEQLMQLAGELVKEDVLETKKGFTLKAFATWIGLFFGREATTKTTIRSTAEALTNKIISTFNNMISSVEETLAQKIVIIVDDLEKTTTEDRMIDILLNHANVIRDLKCHIVLTIPPSLLYSPRFAEVAMTYGTTYFLPPLLVRKKDGSRNNQQIGIMEEIVRRRISDKIISTSIVQFAAEKSGGLVTDFTRMLKLGINYASNDGESQVSQRHLQSAFNTLRNEYDRGIQGDQYLLLENVHRTKNGNKDQDFRNLLFHLRILEYSESNLSWYDVHPAIEALLKQRDHKKPL